MFENYNTKLIMVQHVTATKKDYFGFTVKPGFFYGYVKTIFGKIPVAWSGWTWERGGSIGLYVRQQDGKWLLRWIDEENVPAFHICAESGVWDNEPYFAK